MAQPRWSKDVAAGIGERVARYRKDKRLSAQELADRCAELGMPSINRIVVTRLENGRRDSVSVAEVVVLAKALGVPPLQLVFPVGIEDSAEVLPGLHVDPWDAARWFEGRSGDPTDRFSREGQDAVAESAAMLYSLHDEAGDRWDRDRLAAEEAAEDWWKASAATAAEADLQKSGELRLREAGMRNVADRREHAFRVATDQIRHLRSSMRRLGIRPPVLRSDELARMLGEAEGESSADAAGDG